MSVQSDFIAAAISEHASFIVRFAAMLPPDQADKMLDDLVAAIKEEADLLRALGHFDPAAGSA